MVWLLRAFPIKPPACQPPLRDLLPGTRPKTTGIKKWTSRWGLELYHCILSCKQGLSLAVAGALTALACCPGGVIVFISYSWDDIQWRGSTEGEFEKYQEMVSSHLWTEWLCWGLLMHCRKTARPQGDQSPT